jgi:hypothetical protein
VAAIIFVLVLVSSGLDVALMQNDLGEYMYGAPDYAFRVDQELERNLQLNVDVTVAMPCQCKPPMEDADQTSQSICEMPLGTACI